VHALPGGVKSGGATARRTGRTGGAGAAAR
jgi:hypothetical protein